MKKALSVLFSLFLCCSCVVFAAAENKFEIENNRLVAYHGSEEKVVVPEGVTTLGEGCLNGKSMAEVVLPDSLEVIEDYAMSWCRNLKTVTIPQNVNEIGEYVFDGNESLESIRVADGNRFFCSVDGVLYDVDKEMILKYPEAKTTVGYELPSSVKTIGAGAFYATDLTAFTAGNNIKEIRSWAFADCPNLASVRIGKGINPNNGLKTLGDRVFSGDQKLTEIYLTATLEEIGEFVFDNCTALTTIYIPTGGNHFADVDGVLYTHDGKTLVKYPEGRSAKGFTLPDSVTKLATGAFTRSDFTEIDLTGVTVIEPYALNKCQQLKTVYLGAGLSKVGQGAFLHDEALKDVYFAGTTDTWKKITIERDNEELTKASLHCTENTAGEPAEDPSAPQALEVRTLDADAAVPDIDTSAYRLDAGLDGGSLTGQWRYAAGQAFAYDSFFTLTTGNRGGDYTVTYTMPDGSEDAYRFTAAPYAAYRLTYTYGYAAAGAGYTSRSSVAWKSDSGVSGTKEISVSGGVLRKGYLTVTLLRQDEPPTHKHDWSAPVYTWSADDSSVTAKRTCQTDQTHVETETVGTTIAVDAAACTAAGKTTYTASFTNPAFTKQQKEVAIPAAGHNWDAPIYTWDADNSFVTAVRVCRANERHVETETVNTTKETKANEIIYTAVFTNPAFTKQTKDVPLAVMRQPGDVDADGKVTSADARLALRASVGLEHYEKGTAAFEAADVTRDGMIKPDDARLILRASVGLEDLNKLK